MRDPLKKALHWSADAVLKWAFVTVAISVMFYACAMTQGCASTPEAKDPAVAAYTFELMQCVERASTKAESVACRERVRARYAPLRDAGTGI